MAASTAVGPRGQLRFNVLEGPDLGVDEELLSDQCAEIGTRRVGTTADRNALSGAKKFVGLLWGDTTDNLEYRYTSTGWKKVTGLIRGGVGAGTSSQGGDITVTFSSPFTSACTAIVVTDSNTGGGIGPVPLKVVSRSATGAVIRVMQNEVAVSGFPTSFNYIAFGD
ncbi:gp53-like domain-containing protein [Cryobacterium cryoconiti]|uniref:Putative tail fiber protein gp53-like C-terminal domain-containing protein n=1 Tax=Cryobacterium cryoconiti TaxID=1259239 RepID=A0A4Y8JSN7_9MICO|nr:hypothetical protein [Cryobacterium cryoconiti]TFD27530.1 hypothetical protein E3T49_13390 [Cryobacterium cryoconiti]